MRSLTDRQREIIAAVFTFTNNRGYPPTLAELAETLRVTASTVQGHVDRLIKKGALTRDGEGRRTLRVTHAEFLREHSDGIPLLGRIHAGIPLQSEENAELVEVTELLPMPPGCYALQVAGDSMIEAGIFDGDYVIIDPKRQPNNGETVVAITPDGEATLKEFFREKRGVRLQPRNPYLEPIRLPSCETRGVMVGLLRRT